MMEKLQPKLRFPEYQYNWKNQILGDIAKFSKGKGLSKNDIVENGSNECIRYGELYTHYNETISSIKSKTDLSLEESVVSEINDIIIPASGETQIDIATASCVLKDGVILGGDLNIIKTKEDGVFLSYYLNNNKKREIANLAQGVSVVHLYSSQLSLLKLNLPSLPEQQKIASFLTTVDDKISNLKQKVSLLEKYKKGVMQQIFSQQIRFKDTSGNDYPEWEEKSLGEVCEFYSGGTPLTTNKNFYNGHIPFIKSGEIGEKETKQFITELGLKNSSAKLVSKGDILYALYGATSGEVSISQINGAINQAVLCIKSSQNQVYLFQYLKCQKDNIVSTYIQGGQGNLSANIIKELNVALPSINEQTKIAEFLSGIDEKIETTKLQLNKMEVWKKGLLQGMFC